MISHRKALIRIAEILAGVSSAGALATALAVHMNRLSPAHIEPLLLLLLLIGGAVFCIGVLLFHEFAQAIHGKPKRVFTEEELSMSEMKQLLRWCPKLLLLAYPLAAVILLVTLLSAGSVEWSTGQPFTAREAKGLPMFLAAFILVALPVLASSSRMPGTFSEEFAPKTNGASNDA
jgi:hypothetical protein